MRIGSRTVKNKKRPNKPVVKELTRKEEYQKYLNSDEWKEKRGRFREAYGNKCSECGSTENLHIHHLNYDYVGNEMLEDVMCLCKGCHLKAHKYGVVTWVFTKEEFEAYRKISHIIREYDNRVHRLILLQPDK